jgi:hypothetical protein
MKIARRALAMALITIWKSNSGTAGRRIGSIMLDVKQFLEDIRKDLGEVKYNKLFAIDIMDSMYEEIIKHLVMVDKARLAMTEVVQDIISNSILTPNLNRVNQVIYQIERFIGQADLSRLGYVNAWVKFQQGRNMVRPRIDLVKRDFRNGNMVKCNSLRFYAIDFDYGDFFNDFYFIIHMLHDEIYGFKRQ